MGRDTVDIFKSKEKILLQEQDDATPNWKDLQKQVENRFRHQGWKVFEDVRESMSVSDFVIGLKKGFDEYIDGAMDFVSDVTFESAKEMIKDEGFDVNEIRDRFPEEFDDLRFAIESHANYNIEDLCPSEIFIYDDKYESQGIGSGEHFEEDPDYKRMIVEAKKYGFTDKDVFEVWNNASYGGVGGIGIIAEGGDIYKYSTKQLKTLSGNVILYIRDSMNGSGHYALGTKIKVLKFQNNKDLANNIDYGSYSLGDVFGTRDWSW
jgi:hypothetical protein